MKKNIRITCLALLIVLLVPIFAGNFALAAAGAGELKLEKSEPVDGATGVQTDNVAVKFFFNKNVTASQVQDVNREAFEFIGGEDEEFDIKPYFDPDNDNVIMLTAQRKDGSKSVPLLPKSEYTVRVKAELLSTDGATLGDDVDISFTTVDTSASTKIYILLMVAMVVGMIAMTQVSKKRKERAKAEIEGKIKPANPYKMSKEKGISVEEAMAIIAKEKERRDKRLAKAGIDVEKETKKIKEKLNTKRVKGPRPISAAGGKYKTGRKAVAEKKAKEEAARKAKGTTNPKNKGKKKNKKKK